MLTKLKLYTLAKSRFDEAQILLKNDKSDGAVYLCGYAVELILKRHIVKLLDWDGFPENSKEFYDLKIRSFQVHDLDILLRLAGLEKKVQTSTEIYAHWQIVKTWKSENRYKEIGKISESEAAGMIESTKEMVNFILNIK